MVWQLPTYLLKTKQRLHGALYNVVVEVFSNFEKLGNIKLCHEKCTKGCVSRLFLQKLQMHSTFLRFNIARNIWCMANRVLETNNYHCYNYFENIVVPGCNSLF